MYIFFFPLKYRINGNSVELTAEPSIFCPLLDPVLSGLKIFPLTKGGKLTRFTIDLIPFSLSVTFLSLSLSLSVWSFLDCLAALIYFGCDTEERSDNTNMKVITWMLLNSSHYTVELYACQSKLITILSTIPVNSSSIPIHSNSIHSDSF